MIGYSICDRRLQARSGDWQGGLWSVRETLRMLSKIGWVGAGLSNFDQRGELGGNLHEFGGRAGTKHKLQKTEIEHGIQQIARIVSIDRGEGLAYI